VLTLPVLPLPIIRQLRQRLSGSFATVTHQTVWRNVPPARLYVCIAPTSPDKP
jgi:phosphatidylethanolamine/phosphatidyl-N-methylethanolamine N-methyltransferase